MNNPKGDNKSVDHDENDHTQPINLVAARTVTPASTAATAQPLAMRPHIEPPKPGLMTLYFRTQTPRPPGQVMGPVVGTQVSSTQHFTGKPGPDFKNSNVQSWTVIRMPSSDIIQPGTTTSSSSSALTPGILPSALSGGNRHMIQSAVHPVIAAGNSGQSMASIIRGSHQVPPTGHVIHQQSFSSHVPRGPAAVASISAAPKSAVATPILRTTHSSSNLALSSSSMMSLHSSVRAKSPTLVNRTSTPPVVGSTSLPQVVDLQKSGIGHSLPSTTHHIGLGSRTLDGSMNRTGPSHSSSITIAKPINVSQPIVQHLQQVYDKSNLKTVSNLSTTSSSGATPAHQTVMPGNFTSSTETVGVVPAATRTSAGYSTSIMQLSPSVGQSLQTLRATHLSPSMHSLANVTSSVTPHQTLTVISAKSLMPANHSIALAAPTARTVTPSTSVNALGSTSVLPTSTARPLTTSSNTSAIPIAKVYPQPPPTSRTMGDHFVSENSRVGSFIQQPNSSRVATPVTTSNAPSVMISEKQAERLTFNTSSIRFTSLSKPPVSTSSSATYAPSPTTYLYHDQYSSNLAMHPYSTNASPSGFTSTPLRPVSFSQHSTCNTSPHPSISISNPAQNMNSLMVAVDSHHRVALHPPYGNKPTEMNAVPISTNGNQVSGVTTSPVVTTSYNALQSQGNMNNHTSPRPSILRKRTSDSLNTPAKKNLTSSLYSSEPISPRSELSNNIGFTSVLSPKPNSEKPKDPAPNVAPVVSDVNNLPTAVIPPAAIKREPGVTENAYNSSEALVKDSQLMEASPRKKPRKQLLAANELTETHSSEDDENNFEAKVKVKKEEPDEDRAKCVTYYKRPNMSLLNAYHQPWKAKHNHFARYNDVKPKEEKKPTVNELANQKSILQQANGWKVFHLSAQMEEVIGLEESVYSRLTQLLEFVEKDPPALRNRGLSSSDEDRIVNKLTDLIKGNLQRSKIVQEQVTESKQQAVKVLDHKSNIVDIVNKYISRRPLKKKEKL